MMLTVDATRIDPATGLVWLPDGEFWRIRRARGIYPSEEVPFAIERMRTWTTFFGRKKAEPVGKYTCGFHPDQGVLNACKTAVKYGNEDVLKWQAINKGWDLVGDYPPQKLEPGT